jgi:hypothetical protein
MIPNEDSYCEIDPDTVDQWGIPVLRFHFKWSQDEILQAKHMQDTFQEIITAAGGKVLLPSHRPKTTGASRAAARSFTRWARREMGDDPKTSVLNPTARPGIARILFITDAAPFVSNADKNPTLTITALGWRTSEYIADQVKKRNLRFGARAGRSHGRRGSGANTRDAPSRVSAQSIRRSRLATVRVLCDLIVPADERSGSATQAGVPEFIDDWLDFRKNRTATTIWRPRYWADLPGWTANRARLFGKSRFAGPADQQKQILDRIAWPERAAPEDRRWAASSVSSGI